MVTLPDKQFFRPDEVAKIFSISTKTVYNWIYQGKLDASNIGPKDNEFKVLRVPKSAVELLIHPAIN